MSSSPPTDTHLEPSLADTSLPLPSGSLPHNNSSGTSQPVESTSPLTQDHPRDVHLFHRQVDTDFFPPFEAPSSNISDGDHNRRVEDTSQLIVDHPWEDQVDPDSPIPSLQYNLSDYL